MNLYLIERTDKIGWDEYDSAVVCAESLEDAKKINPCEYAEKQGKQWVDPQHITGVLIGTADPSITRGVVCASFNAG